MTRIAVIGVGNPWRGDDGAGPAVARALDGALPPGATVVETHGEASALIEAWQDADAAIVIDAAVSGGPCGAVHRYDLGHEPPPAPPGDPSGHALGVAYAVALADAIGKLPARAILYAITGRRFDPGAPLSPEVAAAVADVAARVRREVGALQHPAGTAARKAGVARP